MPRVFTNREYADIHFVYGLCDGNSGEASREYHRRYPERRRPDPSVFVQTHLRFTEHGIGRNNPEQNRNFNNNNRRRNMRILREFQQNPTTSVRRASRYLNINPTSIWRALRQDQQHAFHLQPVQGLMPGDYGRRINFCQWLLNAFRRDGNFLLKILWTDEAMFTRRGVVNFHNYHVWAHENPRAIRPTHFQHEFSVNVWLGIIGDNICGPHILPPRLNAVSFFEFLDENIPDVLPLHVRHNSWLQLDGAPAHYGIQVRNWLNANYPRRWIGRGGPVAWPARSPDITPLDFFAWGFLKEKVYSSPVNTRDELIDRINNACDDLRQNQHQLALVRRSLIRRCELCTEENGSHFEHLL